MFITIMISFCLFWVKLTICKGTENIVFRCDSNNIVRLSLGGIKEMILSPFKSNILWHYSVLDLNWIVFTILVSILIHLLFK